MRKYNIRVNTMLLDELQVSFWESKFVYSKRRNGFRLPKIFEYKIEITIFLIQLIGFISEDYAILPNNFITDFEIKRLQFNNYGTLK